MARHRNVRQFGLDDISTYDEALASSVDDDYGISPNTAERYLYNADKRNLSSVVFFGQQNSESLKISEDDFPANENTKDEYSPGYVSGRITSTCSQHFEDIHDEVFDVNELDAHELMVGELDDRLNTAGPEPAAQDKQNVENGVCSISNPSDLVEMDLELLECMTLGSRSHLPNFTVPHRPASLPHYQNSPIFSQKYLDNLKKASLCIDRRIPQCNVPHGTVADRQKKPANSTVILGSKRPSALGATVSSISKRHCTIDLILHRLHQVFYRNHGITILSLVSPRKQLLKPFQFDIPEPVTFEHRQPPVKQSVKTSIPAPRKKKQTNAPRSKEEIIPTPIAGTSELDTEPVRLAEALSQKLDLASQSRERSTPTRPITGANSVTASPSKPIDRTPLLNEYLERKNHTGEKEVVNLIVVGHVDAGKSTLMGNLLYQLGQVSGKQLSKYRWEAQKMGKASFAYAWVLDQTTEERTRGVTMDIAQTSFETKTKRIALMDAPGHKDFVPRVIGGASQADAALLVVNATKGEFETGFGPGGQTREHARLARLLGVSRLIVAVNKMDTVDWAQSRFDQIQSQLSHFLKAMNFTGVVFCPVSGLTGVNLVPKSNLVNTKQNEDLHEDKLFSWYHGPCLLDIIDMIPSPDRTIDGPFRFVVSDIFKPAGLGVPAVAGRVLSGGVSSGLNVTTSKVFCQPSGLPATVKSIRSLCTIRAGTDNAEGSDNAGGLLDQVIKSAFAGDQVALILNGIDPFQSLVPGDVLVDPDNPVPLTSRISAKILVFAVPQPITQGYPVIFYYHCTSIGANVSKLKSMTHKENKMEKTVKKPRCLLGNCTADVEITLERPVCLEVYERCKALGRFMLRVNGESIAGGTVTAILPPKKNRLIDL